MSNHNKIRPVDKNNPNRDLNSRSWPKWLTEIE